MSGVDGGLLRCEKKVYQGHDLGRVGEISIVDHRILELLAKNGFTVVVSPISLGIDGLIYNVNADEAAGAIAAAVSARKVWFISNVAAVLDRKMEPMNSLTPSTAAQLIEDGTIRDGMIPKVRTALDVVSAGVAEVTIANVEGLIQGGGTRFVQA
jgi:acetylglutamate kinase